MPSCKPDRSLSKMGAERGDGLTNLECPQMLESGIRAGRGGIFLRLTLEQLAKLK